MLISMLQSSPTPTMVLALNSPPFLTNPSIYNLRYPKLLTKSTNPSRFILSYSSVDHKLHPRPELNPIPIVEPQKQIATETPEDAQFARSTCEQIEKLVLFKRYREAVELFEILQLRNGRVNNPGTYELLINACVSLRSVRAAKLVFRHIVDTEFALDLYFRNRILLMFLNCGLLADARKFFDEMPERNFVSWNTMILGFVDLGSYMEALDIFLVMFMEDFVADARIFVTAMRASAGIGLISVGRQLHCCLIKLGLAAQDYVSCSLIDMYSKCGCIEEALWVFDEMPEKTVVGWNTIISGYALHGYGEDALDMYYEMQSSGVKMDHFTYSTVVRVCTQLGSMDHARQLHACLVRNGLEIDIVASTALLDFYCKWGNMDDAKRVFDRMPCKNILSWNALIGGYGNHGMGKEAINIFERMREEGIVPNHVTYLAVLGACSSSGLLDKGREVFEMMIEKTKMQPRAMHYSCMIKLLGRRGLLVEAFALIRDAPVAPTRNMWAALLTACRFNKNLELGKFAAERLFGMEPEKLSNYVTLLNIYNSNGRVDDAVSVLDTLRKRGLRLLPACSWIEVKKDPHVFVFGDKSHPQCIQIYKKLAELMEEIKSYGYVPDEKSVLPDVGEEEQRILSYHSEKLAIAFGLINTPELTPLQVVQGHRLCSDCHNFIRFITAITRKEIIVRDASRFHYFKHGTCSCKNYW